MQTSEQRIRDQEEHLRISDFGRVRLLIRVHLKENLKESVVYCVELGSGRARVPMSAAETRCLMAVSASCAISVLVSPTCQE